MAEILDLSEALLIQPDSGAARTHYDLLHLELVSEARGERKLLDLIPITFVENKLLVAVAEGAWDKQVPKRLLPPGGLQKAIKVEVAATDPLTEEASEESFVTLWVGLLKPSLQKWLREEEAVDPTVPIGVVLEDGTTLFAHGPALAEVANAHFSFQTATSEVPIRGEDAEAGGERGAGKIEERMGHLEKSLDAIQKSVGRVLGEVPEKTSVLGVRAKTKAARPGALRKPSRLEGLDPHVVDSARQIGVPEDQLEKLAALLGRPPGGLAEVARPAKSGPLSETEEEEEEEEKEEEVQGLDDGQESGGGDIKKAVVKLTKIAEILAKPKNKKKELDVLLDGLESYGGEGASGSSGGGRSKAAAYKKLRSSLTEDPGYVYETIEKLMREDFQQLRSAPGVQEKPVSSRAWLEHRSKLQFYPGSIRWGWLVAGIHDTLKEGKIKEARARCAVALAALDQASLDNGAWTMAQEVLLEHPAPFASFQNSRIVGAELFEVGGGSLAGGYDMEVEGQGCLPRIEEETITIPRGGGFPTKVPAGGGSDVDPNPKKRANPKEKGKGKGNQKSQEGEPQAPHQP